MLVKTFGCVRFVYNQARQEREAAWVERKEHCRYKQTNALLTKLKADPARTWLREVSCVPLQQALRHLDEAFTNFFRKRAAYPRFRSKQGRQSAEFTKSGFRYKNGQIWLAKMADPLSIRWSRPLDAPPSTVTVIREADGRWYVVCRTGKAVAPLPANDNAVGIDLGLAHFTTLSTGEKIDNPRHLSKRLKRLAHLQRRAARKQKGSKNRVKANLKVARAHSAVRHARQDFLHKLSTRLIRENQTICVETLNVQGMVRNRKLARAISDAGWAQFVSMLSYKAVWHGRALAKIDRWHPSTKTCSVCGTTGHDLPLSVREWDCPDCGERHDRDVNAAKNILAAGLAVSACGGDVRPVAASAA
ncbi:RNA-guided endonuclease InsQ/TnpB family protein [Skermanella rosea]|uniref:RNA-guided endonuclease InsQ/TnpB family protein n=1 Tax=Skermanella rosea TaxID=1817965 RepID=UPI002B1F2594|nr:RNA-guided endonuclease TnpB family protein [Skermanella rosea]